MSTTRGSVIVKKNSKIKMFLQLQFALFVVTDPRLTLIYFLNNELIAYLIYGVCVAAFSVCSVWVICRSRFSWQFFIIMLAGFWGAFLGAVKGLSFGNQLQTIIIYIFLPYLIVLARDPKITSVSIRKLLQFSASLQLLVYLGKDTFFAVAIDSYTVYGLSFAMESANRFTGLWPAPGLLALFSAVVTAYGMARFRIFWNRWDLLLMATGIFLGVASGNRSYFLSLAVTILWIMLWRPKTLNRPDGRSSIIFLIVIGILLVGFFVVGGIDVEIIMKRFLLETLQEDIATRTDGGSGFMPSLRALLQNPVIGSSIYDHIYDDLMVIVDGQRYTTSNGILSILVNNGIFVGLAFIYVYFGAIYRFRRNYLKPLRSDNDILGAVLFFCIVSVTIICIFDALLQMPIALMIILLAYEKLPAKRSSVLTIRFPIDKEIYGNVRIKNSRR